MTRRRERATSMNPSLVDVCVSPALASDMRGRARFVSILVLSFTLALPAAARTRPIVAVFAIQDKTGQLSAITCQLLTEYLSVKIAEGGVFQVIPSRTLKDRLTQLKKESLKDCYDEQCQIDLGKELAASKSLSTSIVRMGSRCGVLGTLYDLKRAASEASASQRSECTQDDLVQALEKVASSLREQVRPREVAPATGPHGELVLEGLPAGARVTVDGVFRGQAPLRERLLLSVRDHDVRVEKPGRASWQKLVWVRDRTVAKERVSLPRMVSVSIETRPPGTRVTLDGEQRGTTPMQLDLAEGRQVALTLEHPDRDPLRERVTIEAPFRLSYTLEPTRRARRSRLEWLGIEVSTGGTAGENGRFLGGGIGIQPITLRWPWVFWTLVEAGFGGGPVGPGWSYVGSRVGVPFYFGRRDQHQVRVGLGIGWGMIALGKMFYDDRGNELGSGGSPVHLSLTAHYYFQTRGRFQVGAGLRVIIPITSSLENDPPASMPTLFLLSIPFGAASLP
jgi:hypothetical protein